MKNKSKVSSEEFDIIKVLLIKNVAWKDIAKITGRSNATIGRVFQAGSYEEYCDKRSNQQTKPESDNTVFNFEQKVVSLLQQIVDMLK